MDCALGESGNRGDELLVASGIRDAILGDEVPVPIGTPDGIIGDKVPVLVGILDNILGDDVLIGIAADDCHLIFARADGETGLELTTGDTGLL